LQTRVENPTENKKLYGFVTNSKHKYRNRFNLMMADLHIWNCVHLNNGQSRSFNDAVPTVAVILLVLIRQDDKMERTVVKAVVAYMKMLCLHSSGGTVSRCGRRVERKNGLPPSGTEPWSPST